MTMLTAPATQNMASTWLSERGLSLGFKASSKLSNWMPMPRFSRPTIPRVAMPNPVLKLKL